VHKEGKVLVPFTEMINYFTLLSALRKGVPFCILTSLHLQCKTKTHIWLRHVLSL